MRVVHIFYVFTRLISDTCFAQRGTQFYTWAKLIRRVSTDIWFKNRILYFINPPFNKRFFLLSRIEGICRKSCVMLMLWLDSLFGFCLAIVSGIKIRGKWHAAIRQSQKNFHQQSWEIFSFFPSQSYSQFRGTVFFSELTFFCFLIQTFISRSILDLEGFFWSHFTNRNEAYNTSLPN